MQEILQYLQLLYPDSWQKVSGDIDNLVEKWRAQVFPAHAWVDSSDVLMIAYGDALQAEGEAPLATMKRFMDAEFKEQIKSIHLLPMFPYSSDDGFSVVDFYEINPEYGTWQDVEQLAQDYDMMYDAVINHVSRQSAYFKGYLEGDPRYTGFFTEADPDADYSSVVRPRTLPLLTPFETSRGKKYLWTTFSDDQIDLNYKEPAVLLEMLNVLLLYAQRGARFIRFDAIGFAWKQLGTGCMHLPEVHALIKLMRAVVQSLAPGCTIITETNVPHKDNISYFGNGHDEAGMVYQFPLPPLVLYSFLTGNAAILTGWAAGLEPTSEDTTYFNFLASHDGIGMRPVEDILDGEAKALMAQECLARGGEIGYRTLPDGSEAPYELNINYLDAVAGDAPNEEVRAQKFLASQCILLSVMGMPAIYYHSLLGSRGNRELFEQSGIKRRINREKLDAAAVQKELHTPGTLRSRVVEGYKHLLLVRRAQAAFHPNSPQQVLKLDDRVFSILRGTAQTQQVLVLVNVSGDTVELATGVKGTDLLTGEACEETVRLAPWQFRWINTGV